MTLAPHAVELLPHDPRWADSARAECDRLHQALGDLLVIVHHIGSTAIAGIRAKPVIDLIPVFSTSAALDDSRPLIESLGYRCWGEFGLPGRRFCTFDDPVTNLRKFNVHGYEVGSPEIRRHLAFRDYLRKKPELARAYESMKEGCRALHPSDSQAYSACKNDWIQRIEQEALAHFPPSPAAAPV